MITSLNKGIFNLWIELEFFLTIILKEGERGPLYMSILKFSVTWNEDCLIKIELLINLVGSFINH